MIYRNLIKTMIIIGSSKTPIIYNISIQYLYFCNNRIFETTCLHVFLTYRTSVFGTRFLYGNILRSEIQVDSSYLKMDLIEKSVHVQIQRKLCVQRILYISTSIYPNQKYQVTTLTGLHMPKLLYERYVIGYSYKKVTNKKTDCFYPKSSHWPEVREQERAKA